MTIKWDKVGAIFGVASFFVAGCAIFVQVATPEIRCRLGLEKNGCLDVDNPSPKAVNPSPIIASSASPSPLSIIISSPSPDKGKPDVGTPSLQASQDAKQSKNREMQDKLLGGLWVSANACKVNNQPVQHRTITTFYDKTISELIFFTFVSSKSTLFSTKMYEVRTSIQVTYEWSIEESLLQMKRVDRVVSIEDVLLNGKLLKSDDSMDKSLKDIKGRLEEGFSRSLTKKYKILSLEEDSMVLEKIGGTQPLCENSFIVKYLRTK